MADKYIVNASDLTGIADAIREKSDTTELLVFPNGFASTISNIDTDAFYEKGYEEGYEEGYVDGEKESGGFLWKYTKSLSSLFADVTFPENTSIDLYIENPIYITNSFKHTNIVSVKLKGNINENYMEAHQCFFMCARLVIADFSEFNLNISNATMMFRDCSSLTDIIGKIDLSKASSVSTMFAGCKKLKNVEFAENTIKLDISFSNSGLLTDKSIQFIIDGLADMTGKTAKIVTFHSDVVAKLTAEQLTTIMDKNWNIG